MEKKYELLLSQLIGLARATDGSEHLITPASTAVVLESLRAIAEGSENVEELTAKVLAAKREMVPNCFTCANPCGRTESYDLSRLEKADPEIRRLKYVLLEQLCRLAVRKTEGDCVFFYRMLTVMGLEDYTAQDLQELLDAMKTIRG